MLAQQGQKDGQLEKTMKSQSPETTPKKIKRCFLHIGSSKTGTSSIQGNLYRHRKYLQSLGYFYPNNAANHIFFASRFREDPTEIAFHTKSGRDTPALVEKHIEEEMAEFEADLAAFSGQTLILSSEYLPPTSADMCVQMAEYLHSFCEEVTVVCYVRHPVSHATSAAQQTVMVGFKRIAHAQNFAHYFKASQVLPKFINAFGRENMAVRKFERSALYKENAVSDLLHVAGLSDEEIANIEQREANSSLCHEMVLVADALTKQFPRTVDGLWNPERAKRVNLMAIKGSKFTLDPEVVAGIEAAAEADLDFLRSEFAIEYQEGQGKKDAPAEPAWREETIDGLAARMNELALEAQHWKAEARFHMSMQAEEKKQAQKAMKFAREAIDLNPLNFAYLKHVAALLRKRGRWDEAFAHIERFIKLKPEDARGPKLLADLRKRAGDSVPSED